MDSAGGLVGEILRRQRGDGVRGEVRRGGGGDGARLGLVTTDRRRENDEHFFKKN